MLRIVDEGRGGGVARRDLLQAGALTVGGLSLPGLLNASVQQPTFDRAFGSAKNVIFLYLAGGPPQHETFDPKPDAPSGIRGAFNPIATNIPGMQFCELLPRTANLADRMAIVRSMATDDNIHSSSGSWVLTGYKYRGPNARTITPTDWPNLGTIVKMLRPSEELPGLSTAWLPDVWRLNENVTPAGQSAGFLGSQWNPDVFVGDPSEPTYEIESLRADLPSLQLSRRQSLLTQFDERFARSDRVLRVYDTFQQQAFDLLTSGRARQAFDIAKEPDAVRDRYGRNRWGQCVLLARRLIEAGVRLVHVQWPREPGDNAVDNPLWDTHAQNADRLEDVLCPMFDVGYSALIEDLDQRGLLDETLVVAIGEFGRTPKINPKGGRDHWGPVFSCALAGAGIRGGQVYGESDKHGAYPASDRAEPGDLTATIFHLLGLNYQGAFADRQGREFRLTEGEPMWKLLGSQPATIARIEAGGDVSRVPPFDPTRHLLHTQFTKESPILPTTAPSRPKGWRGTPLADSGHVGLGVRLVPGGTGETGRTDTGHPRAAIGFRLERGAKISGEQRALLGQEVRSPFAGMYRLRVRLRLHATSKAAARFFEKHCACRLTYLQFKDQTKRIDEASQLAATPFEPVMGELQTVELTKNFVNPTPGGNFSFGSGLAIGVEVVTAKQVDEWDGNSAVVHVEVADVELAFLGKPRNIDVTV